MLFNKNNYRKAGEKKVLHKVGKEWKVVSVALLMAIAGGAVAATHANANADATDAANNDYNALNSSVAANPEVLAPASATSTTSASSSAEGIHYYPGHNGAAASYFDNVDNDNATANKYYRTVNSYVNSLTSEYQPQVKSLATKSASAKNAAKNDSNLAKSYGATAKKNATFNTISSLAAKHNMDPNVYKDMVQDQEQIYSNAVSSASADVKAASDVTSLVNMLDGANLTQASLSASTAAYVAKSNLGGAEAVKASVDGFGPKGNNASNYLNVADKLSAGVLTLQATGNPETVSADVDNLLQDVPAANRASASSAVNSAAAAATKSAKSTYDAIAASANNINSLESYAGSNAQNEGAFNDLVVNAENTVFANSNTDLNDNPNYITAVSAATNEEFAPVLASAADSLYGYYNPELADYKTRAAEFSSASASAAHKVTAAQFAYNTASANYDLIQNLSGSVSASGKSAVASTFLSEGVSGFASEFKIGSMAPSQANPLYSTNIKTYNGTDEYTSGLMSLVNTANPTSTTINNLASTLTSDSAAIDSNNGTNTYLDKSAEANESNVAAQFASDYYAVSDVAKSLSANLGNTHLFTSATDKYTLSHGVDLGTALTTGVSASYKALASALVNDTNVNNVTFATATASAGIQTSLNNAVSAFGELSASANNVSATASSAYGLSKNASASSYFPGANANAIVAALLSDSVDYDALSAESGAIDNVKNAVASATNSLAASANNKNTSAQNFSSALNIASASASSADSSAVNASASDSTANDEDVTLASYFASSYASDADVESDDAVNASSDLNSFWIDMAADPEFTDADNAYSTAVAAASTDYKLGVANAQYVYNNSYHFLDVLKGARLHSTPNFGSKNMGDKVVGSVKKGDRLTVYGVNVSRNHNWRGVVRYFVKDNTNGAKGFFTGQPEFSKGAYLSATADHANVEVKTLKPVNVYAEINGKKAIKSIPAGQVIENADVVYDNDSEDAYGFTKVETPDYHFFTANSDYVEIVTPTAPKNNTQQSNFNFNLQNPDQHMADYYNNLSQD